jgi:uncharacterized LabA/DUF88 family protein
MTYKTKFGLLNYLKIWPNRLFWTGILVMALINFEENRTGLGILIMIALIILVRIKSEELIDDGENIFLTRKYFYDVIPITSQFRKDEIEEIRVDGNRTIDAIVFMNFLPFGAKIKNTVQIELKNKTIQTFKTDIFLEELNTFKDQF